MNSTASSPLHDSPSADAPPPEPPLPPTPRGGRAGIAAGVGTVGAAAYALHTALGYRVQAAAGIVCFLGVAAVTSRSLPSVRPKTILWGVALQFALAAAVLHSSAVRAGFEVVGKGIGHLLAASDRGAEFVFGSLAKADGPAGFVFAFK